MKRRDFVGLALAVPPLGMIPAVAAAADLSAVPTRKAAKVEIAYKSPGPTPNGLQATEDGLWVLDAGNNRAYLVQYDDGKILRSFDTESQVGSGITYSPDGLWIAVTPNRVIIRVDPMTGKTLQTYATPGAGVAYRMVGDPTGGRPSPVPAQAAASAQGGQPGGAQDPPPARGGGRRGGGARGQAAPGSSPGTGANGLEWKDGKIWMAVPPARQVFGVDDKTWVVQQRFNTAANRPHGMGWEGNYLWVADSNLNGFFKHDTNTGQILEKILLTDKDPVIHGMTIWRGLMWYCDEAGVICRFKMS